jgi:predicted naringenin-chalcone synthase
MYVRQEEAFEFYDSHFMLTSDERELYRRILCDGSIEGRYIGMNSRKEALETNPDKMIDRFLKFGVHTGANAARKAMEEAKCSAQEIGGLVVNTCTGYLCPGLSSYIAEALGLSSSVRVMDLTGMGCGAAIPNMECAAGIMARGARRSVLSISVEICSATLFMGSDPELVVSNSIFGDGAAAAVIGVNGNGHEEGLLQLVDFESGLFPNYREQLRYRTEQGRLRNVLSRRVPVVGANAIAHVTERLLSRHKLSMGDIGWWAVHAGGTAVLEQVGKKLKLNDEDLSYSYGVFREYGNMSSPTVMFVLKKILDEGRPKPGDRGVLLSFGAGFTAFAALVVF